MAVGDSGHDLAKEDPRSILRHGTLRRNPLKQLAAAGILHNQTDISLPENNVQQFYDVGVLQFDCDV